MTERRECDGGRYNGCCASGEWPWRTCPYVAETERITRPWCRCCTRCAAECQRNLELLRERRLDEAAEP